MIISFEYSIRERTETKSSVVGVCLNLLYSIMHIYSTNYMPPSQRNIYLPENNFVYDTDTNEIFIFLKQNYSKNTPQENQYKECNM